MSKAFLLKTFLLILLLAVVLLVMFSLMRADSGLTASDGLGDQNFFSQFVIAGGPIVWFVLLPMSIITVFLAAEHSLTIRRKKLLPENTTDQLTRMLKQQNTARLKDMIAEQEDFVSIAVLKAVCKAKGDWFRIRNAADESLQEQALALLRKIEWLNLIGNVAPMVGLFGTVFGMIKLFNAIVVAGGQPQPAHLADGISVALVTTLWGLFIAIPALALHGVFRNRIETLISEASEQTDNIIGQIRIGSKNKNTTEPLQQKLAITEIAAEKKAKTGNPSLPLR